MAKLYDISEWSEQPWWNTGGTRNKKVYLNPEDGKLYYFKQSFNKGQRNYEYEFWSEIIASEVGKLLGFDLLEYHIAIRGNIIGCISESMIDPASEELVEGGKYLQALDNTFEPEDTKKRNRYDFQLIHKSLFAFGMGSHIKDITDIILFDSFIGNSDRHQENWAFINTHSNVSRSFSEMVDTLSKIEGKEDQIPSGIAKWLVKKFYMVKGKVRPEFKKARLMFAKEKKFAPIYDSGCSFGRELKNKKVSSMLKNSSEIETYLDKGLAEIHWEREKINHFELLKRILNEKELKDQLLTTMERALKKFKIDKIEEMIKEVDNPLNQLRAKLGLPQDRKDLMIKLLALRRDRIQKLYQQYSK
ncbi:MAG: hypothetical protein RLQ12_16785 [Cyclobacteriaceae bacterium]